ncbi:MAG TPA: D-glucuronyl C5-epimerase family protein [Nitrospira sp.]|nr:D-glucuronyl C5-epimerase family protein [Nitrospira sp.]
MAKNAERHRKTTTVDIDGVTAHALKIPNDPSNLTTFSKIFTQPRRYPTELSGGTRGGVHPVYAISSAYLTLLQAYSADITPGARKKVLKAVIAFVDNYLIPKKVEIAPGVVSWAYGMDWTVNWGIRLSPPWYSAYANANAAALCAILYHVTKDGRYKRLAREAAAYLSLPLGAGGSEYDISGFKYPAEYVYSSLLPNVRVLDGEVISVLALYNAARFLGDSEMLRIAYRQMASLAMAMEYYREKNGNLYFAYYIEEMPEHYKWQVWSALQILALVAKEQRFADAAQALLPNVPAQWCEANGC